MSVYTVRSIEPDEFRDIFKRIRQDFDEGEYAPYEVLRQQLKNGIQQGLIFQMDGCEVAYAICAGSNRNRYVLISLLAVYREFRGSGLGTMFLEEIKRVYEDKNGIIVEVEKPEEAENPEERTIRKKRISFYEKAGFCLIPDVDYSIWDVPMHLMVFPQREGIQSINREIGRIIYAIYLELMGERYIHKMKFSII